MATARVALLIETSTSWGSGIVRGITRYAREYGPWQFYLEPAGRYERLTVPDGWFGDGIIARVIDPRLASKIERSNVPTVNVSWNPLSGKRIARCTVDEWRSAEIAAEHFLERGFRHFAYCGPMGRPHYSDGFGAAFANTLREKGFDCVWHPGKYRRITPANWQDNLADLTAFIEKQDRPLALLTFDDMRGRQVTEACGYAGIRVPDDVAVLTGDHDELFSIASQPALSGVDPSATAVGYEAARLLSTMMAGATAPAEPVLVQPRGVITNASTDTLAIEDHDLAAAVRYIRDHAYQPINVEDVVRHTPLSRRVLEKRFRKQLGRSPTDELRRARIALAKEWLAESLLPMTQVAARSGFEYAEVMTRVFGKETGMTPTDYRRRYGAR